MAPALPSPPALGMGDALILDFDGTLVEIAERPDLVRVPTLLPPLLQELHRFLGGALALVTGRALQDVDARLRPVVLPGAGLHGRQMRIAVGAEAPPLPRDPHVERMVNALLVRVRGIEGLLVEDKGAAVALHYRQAPLRRTDCRRWMEEALEDGLELIEGHCVFEARPAGYSKGRAIEALCAQAPFAGRRPICLGDDRTDEDGFTAVQALGGCGVKVGPGPTAARYRLAGVSTVLDWLNTAVAAPMS